MDDEQRETGTGWPGPAAPGRPAGPAGEPDPRPEAPDPDEISPLAPVEESQEGAGDGGAVDAAPAAPVLERDSEPASGAATGFGGVGRVSSAGVMIAVLLALLGFTLVVQLKTTSTDPTLAATRQEDLVRIYSDLDSREKRLQQDIEALEESQRQLRSGEQGRQAALEEARRRADELGILAGTLPC
ncbi:hypothetical protein E1193_30630, partial [Micromonospora sp. KC606]